MLPGPYLVVRVLAEVHRDRRGSVVMALQRSTHVVEGLGLEHEVMEHGCLRRQERQAVVARVAPEEHDVLAVGSPVVAHAEPEDLRVEGHRLGDVRRAQHDVAHAERAGDEAADPGRRHERHVVEDRAVEELEREPSGVGRAGEAPHAARPRLGLGRELDGTSGRAEPDDGALERGGVAELPPGEGEPFGAGRR